jgi:signal transduction histidine kinase
MTPKILIVDDDPSNRSTLESILLGCGYELNFATNGLEACEQTHAWRPDLILLDVMMPEIDGFEVCRRIRRDPQVGRVPILLLTALDDDRSRLEGLLAGADDFLTKPCHREEIRARVRTVVSLNRFRTIAEQRARFERLFELAPGAIVLVDAKGIIVAANARAEGCPPGASLCASFSGAAAALGDLVATAQRVEKPPVVEIRQCSGATDRILHVRAAAVPEGDARLVMLVFDDVTAEVQARDALERMNRELEEKVRARTRQLEEANGLLLSYASFVSHDLRSPLTVMKGYLSLLHEGVVPVNADAEPLVARAYGATVVMQELVQNILQLAQDEHEGAASHSSVALDPTPVIQRLVVHLSDLFSKPAPRFSVAALPRVGVSSVVLERVFYNLITNALKYSAQRPEPHIEIGVVEGGDGAGPVLFVRDNGVGFDARDADKLFQEFSRLPTAGATPGFGLGLSLVTRLLRAHGGRIWAEGAAGVGATFYVQLPPPANTAHSRTAPAMAKLAG